MLEVIKGTEFVDYDGRVWPGYSIFLTQIPPIRHNLRIGMGGGFRREKDAKIGIDAIRKEWPHFDFDNCNYKQYIKWYLSLHPEKMECHEIIRRVIANALQW